MTVVIIALLPALLFGMYNVGYQHNLAIGADPGFLMTFIFGFLAVLPKIIVSYVVGLGIEFAVAQVKKEEIQEGFLVSGILIPMIVPVDTPLWMIAVATAFAVVFAKEVFGGTGYNVFNVALVTRAFLFFAYPAASVRISLCPCAHFVLQRQQIQIDTLLFPLFLPARSLLFPKNIPDGSDQFPDAFIHTLIICMNYGCCVI